MSYKQAVESPLAPLGDIGARHATSSLDGVGSRISNAHGEAGGSASLTIAHWDADPQQLAGQSDPCCNECDSKPVEEFFRARIRRDADDAVQDRQPRTPALR